MECRTYTELGLYIEGKWLNGDGRKLLDTAKALIDKHTKTTKA